MKIPEKLRAVNPDQLPKTPKKKVMSEKETIESILKLAREQGVEDKVKKLIAKYQAAVAGARSQEEAAQIGALGLVEIHKAIGCVGGLVVNGVELIPQDTGYDEEINWHKRLAKLD